MTKKIVTNTMFKDACTEAQRKCGITQDQLAKRLSMSRAKLCRLQNNGNIDVNDYTKLLALATGSSQKKITAMIHDVFSALFHQKEKDS